jgi:DNA-binding HxlR family transcriptional regulator
MSRMKLASDTSCLQNTVDVLGDKWTALIINELAQAPSCFCDVEKTLPGISPRTLSQRLDRLQTEGIISKQLYKERPPRYNYHLTPKGLELTGIINAMSDWGTKYR